jgi:3-oxoacyl-[acyl-carrier-protein] synthase II
VVVTGMGVITSLGAGKADNWAKLVDGKSGIRRISRFSNEGLKTKLAGTVDFVPVEPFCSIELGERMAAMVAEEAIAEAGIGAKGDFPGPPFLAVAPVEMEWPHREAFAAAMLGFEVAQSTVSKYMVRGGTPPSHSATTIGRMWTSSMRP